MYCRLSVNTQLLARVDQLLKVGKNNFRPPPKVESRVVRIEPRQPPPPVNFLEWDGLIRILFNRKNKTIRATLMTDSVLKILEANARTVAALRAGKEVPVKEQPKKKPAKHQLHSGLEEVDEDMAIDAFSAQLSGSTAAPIVPEDIMGPDWSIKAAVEEVLKVSGYGEKRSSKCSIDDFLTLLAACNAAGIHFHA